MARPRFHALATAPVAAFTYRRWGLIAAIGVTATGVFVDLDHLADYLWVRLRGRRSHFLAPLHAWELVAVWGLLALWLRRRRVDLLWAQHLLGGLMGGLVLHLVQDVLTNRPRHAGVYAILYRLRHGFDRDRIGWGRHEAFHAWSGKPWYTWF